ncbi:MAG: hypothetical protein CMN54_12790 [SAR324 cluster bacterium]|uniref:Uncharacterized protein n=1 Tax=SAR324 cluster bacterium TaxID=2024889 RepID=A0A2D6YMC0_9DELT|nr:hypothetical protein [SAR324 cluster bacterium]
MQKHHHVLHDRVEPAALGSPNQGGDWDTGTASAEDVTNQPGNAIITHQQQQGFMKELFLLAPKVRRIDYN